MDNIKENQEDEIDLKELISIVKNIWNKNKKFIITSSIIGIIIGIVVAFSIPKEYTTTVILAPESGTSQGVGNMGTLAAMAGINMGSNSDGLSSPELYPNIIQSTPFVMGLFNIEVDNNGDKLNLYTYMKDYQKSSWWSYVFKAPFKLLGMLTRKSNLETISSDKFTLTKDDFNVIENIKGNLKVSVDKKTGIITLTTVMQNPKVSAVIADTLTSYLQSYIINYRTQKARFDLDFTEKLYNEAKKDYTISQEKYARYSDKNQNVILASYRVTQEKLQNEMALAYGVYNQMAQQLQLARVKVQDITPVYTVIQPSITPLQPSKPNKKLIVIGFAFLAFIGSCGWVMARNYLK